MSQPIVCIDTSEVRAGRLAELKAAMHDLALFVQPAAQPCGAGCSSRPLRQRPCGTATQGCSHPRVSECR
jgi:hypothetical protein